MAAQDLDYILHTDNFQHFIIPKTEACTILEYLHFRFPTSTQHKLFSQDYKYTHISQKCSAYSQTYQLYINCNIKTPTEEKVFHSLR